MFALPFVKMAVETSVRQKKRERLSKCNYKE